MKYIYDKSGNLITSIFEGTDEQIKEQYKEAEFISESYLGEKALVENSNIRAMTRIDKIKLGEESLLEGEYIKDNEILSIEKPSNFHLWDPEIKSWNYNKQLEIDFINSEILNKEIELNDLYDTLDKATARRLKALVADSQAKIDKIIEELEALENRLEELEG